MQLNDPFGRVSRRQQQAYASLRSQLRQQGMHTSAGARAARDKLGRTTLHLALIVAVLFGAVAVLFPALQGAAVVTAALVLVWLTSSYLQTRAHLNNYLDELVDAERRGAHDPRPEPTSEEERHENTND